MASSKKWASIISAIASFIYFIVIVFQIRLFSVQCGTGVCKTPIEAISSQLIGNELVPLFLVKALLYPGVFGRALINGKDLPSSDKVLNYYSFTNMKKASFVNDIQHLEVLAGSCLCVVGAFLSLVKPRRISFIGALLIFWGLIRESFFIDSSGLATNLTEGVRIYPTMFLAAVSAFLSIRSNVRTMLGSCRPKAVSKSL